MTIQWSVHEVLSSYLSALSIPANSLTMPANPVSQLLVVPFPQTTCLVFAVTPVANSLLRPPRAVTLNSVSKNLTVDDSQWHSVPRPETEGLVWGAVFLLLRNRRVGSLSSRLRNRRDLCRRVRDDVRGCI